MEGVEGEQKSLFPLLITEATKKSNALNELSVRERAVVVALEAWSDKSFGQKGIKVGEGKMEWRMGKWRGKNRKWGQRNGNWRICWCEK